ncbi:MAG: hypothetical protein WC284_04405 [Candidimonas sp.]
MNDDGELFPFIDYLFNCLIVFITMAVLAFLLINPPDEGGVKPDAEYMITITWPKGDIDVDLYVQQMSTKGIVYFKSRESGIMFLERDDLGDKNDFVIIDYQQVKIETNKEIVFLRGKHIDEYAINVHLYRYDEILSSETYIEPVEVVVEVAKLVPSYEVVYTNTVKLSYVKEEIHVVRFTTSKTGITDVTHLMPIMMNNKIIVNEGFQ